jgi:chromosome segregation ATPase
VRERAAGRVGFFVAGDSPADAVRALIADVQLVSTREEAKRLPVRPDARWRRLRARFIALGRLRVEGGARDEARSILTTKREIKELRERADDGTRRSSGCSRKATGLDLRLPRPSPRSPSLQAELHRKEKAVVGYDLQVTTAAEARTLCRGSRSRSRFERRSAEEELRAQERREDEARESIQRIETEQRAADEQLSAAQRKLFEARETAANQSRVTAEAQAAHAALVERAARWRSRCSGSRMPRASSSSAS